MKIGLAINKLIFPENQSMEVVERKGAGHPDSICDKAAEELSIALSNWYLDNVGRVLHHNVDKAILVGGQSNAYIGGGEVLEPMNLLLVGRAVDKVNGHNAPMGKLVIQTTKNWLRKELPQLDVNNDIIIDYRIRSGSTDLVGNFEEVRDMPRANDTSIGIGFAPLTKLESIVYTIETMLNNQSHLFGVKELGQDIKVMGTRIDDIYDITIACAMVSKYIPTESHYWNMKQFIVLKVINTINLSYGIPLNKLNIKINVADIKNQQDKLYLTVTGTSAEHGDDGQVGRGNRTNGLITPYRQMTLEAAAGKNPINHVGKMYNIIAQEITKEIYDKTKIPTSCCLVSEIGKPINEPKFVGLTATIDLPKSLKFDRIVKTHLNGIDTIWEGFLKRKYSVY
jgi:S-adenosylmethionine synthetase